jgi:hypothetical protein
MQGDRSDQQHCGTLLHSFAEDHFKISQDLYHPFGQIDHLMPFLSVRCESSLLCCSSFVWWMDEVQLTFPPKAYLRESLPRLVSGKDRGLAGGHVNNLRLLRCNRKGKVAKLGVIRCLSYRNQVHLGPTLLREVTRAPGKLWRSPHSFFAPCSQWRPHFGVGSPT